MEEQKIKKSKKGLLLPLLVVVLIVGGLFYWFEYRPMMDRKNCIKTAIKYYDTTHPYNNLSYLDEIRLRRDAVLSNQSPPAATSTQSANTYNIDDYKSCLRSKGYRY
ncbi:MAG: hypothetical protein COY66_05075 [Candidatus Kerfeldbacteria bacterium CG_4_10_14_0_8_um_filter_42_10]|uniref:Uncharacterized protein n=1 Tax=Candidatus Kerfeldbacteria bacterium CG_4_10_14_0_8_um_filter_42_10 TaxID=2014248 RepID=A0A2M7RH71_9BACT|nr:MAG: hypothetical protein COY66_05075 [Candidatus Kerfeldbacteria bacterium CG_4_10_14_0_8_um_filter_42_10]